MNQEKQIVFIGTYADGDYLSELINNNVYDQFAANQTEEYYINGLREKCSDVKVFSALVIPSFPHSKQIIMPARCSGNEGRLVHNIGFVNLPIIRFISQAICFRREINRQFIRNNKKDLIVVTYAMRLPFYAAAKYIKSKFPEALCINIIPDIPIYMHLNDCGILSRLKGRLNQRLLLNKIKYFDGFVLYAKAMRDVLNCDEKNSVVIEGIVSDLTATPIEVNKQKRIVLYAGGIDKKYGVSLLAQGFIEANLADTEIHFYGKGDYSTELMELAKQYPNVKYYGVVEPSFVKEKMKEASLLINPRPTNEEFTKYSCPSKTLEYMASGVPVMTTRLGGIPDEYYDYLYVIEEETINGIAHALREFFDEEIEMRQKKANSARTYIVCNKNYLAQTNRLLSFADSLRETSLGRG